ncbi:MAG: hypothetical protein P1V97_01345, partial [Planctomycetota bacterium]|nr:hypothetical protein [Planctomycetota bacterium]
FWKTAAANGDEDHDEEDDNEEDSDIEEEKESRPLPVICTEAFKKAHPKGKIQSTERHSEYVHTIYEVAFLEGDELKHTAIVDTGAILELEVSIKVNLLPAAVSKALESLFGKVTVAAANKETICAEIQTVPLKESIVYYEALLSHDGKEAEAAVMPNGEVLAKAEWHEPEHDDHDHDHPHEDDREEEDDEDDD